MLEQSLQNKNGGLQDLICVLLELMMRVAQPYSSYDDFDFVPVGKDTYDRFVFVTEVWEV
jgi:hypothetical protein